jgi:STE24 endopeptidase
LAKRWLRSFSQEASRVWKRSQHSPKLPAMAVAAQNHDIANPSERAKKYTKTALQLKQAKLLVAFGLPVMILALDYDRLIAERANNITGILPLQVLLVWSAIYLLIVVFSLALSLLSYRVERKFSLTSTSIGKWLLDFLKASGVVFIFLLIVLESIYASFALYPQLWWMFATVAIGITYAAMIYLAPSVILPLFFKSTPLEDGALRERITHVCALAHREAHEVEVLNIRKRTHKANAMVLGWGRRGGSI